MEITVQDPLTTDQARALTDEARREGAALWRKLAMLYERGAHTALGYSSWGAYCQGELDLGRSYGYRLVQAAEIADALESPNGDWGDGGTPEITEAVARELVPLRDAPEKMVEVITAVRESGAPLTAKEVRPRVNDARQAIAASRPPRQVDPFARSPREVDGWVKGAVVNARMGERYLTGGPPPTGKRRERLLAEIRELRAYADSMAAHLVGDADAD